MQTLLQCPDGSTGRLKTYEPPARKGNSTVASPSIHRIDCSDSTTIQRETRYKKRNALLEKRQDFICTAECTQSCYSGQGGPNPDHCDDLAEWMWERADEWTVQAGEKIVLGSGSCVYTFTNERSSAVTWCDDEWAETLQRMAWRCNAANNARGGVCVGDRWREEVIANDGSVVQVPGSAPPTRPTTTSNAPVTSPRTSRTPTPITSPSGSPPTTPGTQDEGVGDPGGSSQQAGLPSATFTPSTTSFVTLSSDGHVVTQTVLIDASGEKVTVIMPTNTGSQDDLIVDGGSQEVNGGGSKPNIAAIVGGVLGGLALIILIVGFLLLWRRKQRHNQKYAKKRVATPIAPSPPTFFIGPTSKAAQAEEDRIAAEPLPSPAPPYALNNNPSHSMFPPATPSSSRPSPSLDTSNLLAHPSSEPTYSSIPPTSALSTTSANQTQHYPMSPSSVLSSSLDHDYQGTILTDQIRDTMPNMSQVEIDRLAQRIVYHMRGREPSEQGAVERDPPPPFEG